VPEFVEPEKWSPNSPDLNPVDYSIWEVLQQFVYHRIQDVEHLKKSCKTAGSRLVKMSMIALYDSFANDCRSLLQLVEDTLIAALTNVFMLHVRYHTYVFCCRNTEFGQIKSK